MSELTRILSVERDQSGCNQYRIVQPLYKLLMNNLANILTINSNNCHKYDFIAQKIIESDILVLHRPADDRWLNLTRVAQNSGKLVVADYDDDPFNISPWNPAYRYYGTKNAFYSLGGKDIELWQDGVDGFMIEENVQRRDMFRLNFRKADLVTCTTDVLKETLSKINSNVVVLPNLIDFNILKPLDIKSKEIRIGYTFGASHYEDFYLVRDVLKKVAMKYDNVKLVFFGDSSFHGLFKGFPENKIEWHSWVSVPAYPYKLMTLNFDIGICPLVDNVFNRNKSSLKWMEYSALKVPTVASNIPPYSNTITNGVDGMLVKDDEWETVLCNLIENKRLRTKLAKNAYSNVRENHCADKFAYKWIEAYDGLLKRDVLESLK